MLCPPPPLVYLLRPGLSCSSDVTTELQTSMSKIRKQNKDLKLDLSVGGAEEC